MRQIMCPKCGVKLSNEYIEDEVIIQFCLGCKQKFITVNGKLKKKLETISYITGKSLNELLENAIKKWNDENA